MPIYDPSSMSEEEKFAFADKCKIDFPCQACAAIVPDMRIEPCALPGTWHMGITCRAIV